MKESTVRLTIPDDHVAFWEGLFPRDFDPLVARVMYATRALAKQINEEASKWLERFSLTAAQYNYLVVLHVSGGNLTLNEIATRIHTSNATVATMVAVLEREGLVRRDPNPRDARSVLVSLTPRGVNLVNRAFPYHQRRLRTILARISKREQEQLLDLLLRVGAGVASSADDRSTVPRAKGATRRRRAGKVASR